MSDIEAKRRAAARARAEARAARRKKIIRRRIIAVCILIVLATLCVCGIVMLVRKATGNKRAIKTYMKGITEMDVSQIEKVTDPDCRKASKADDTIGAIEAKEANKTESKYEILNEKKYSKADVELLEQVLYGNYQNRISKATEYKVACTVTFSGDSSSGVIQNEYLLVSYKKGKKWYVYRKE